MRLPPTITYCPQNLYGHLHLIHLETLHIRVSFFFIYVVGFGSITSLPEFELIGPHFLMCHC